MERWETNFMCLEWEEVDIWEVSFFEEEVHREIDGN